jgi:hypothetical protein
MIDHVAVFVAFCCSNSPGLLTSSRFGWPASPANRLQSGPLISMQGGLDPAQHSLDVCYGWLRAWRAISTARPSQGVHRHKHSSCIPNPLPCSSISDVHAQHLQHRHSFVHSNKHQLCSNSHSSRPAGLPRRTTASQTHQDPLLMQSPPTSRSSTTDRHLLLRYILAAVRIDHVQKLCSSRVTAAALSSQTHNTAGSCTSAWGLEGGVSQHCLTPLLLTLPLFLQMNTTSSTLMF